MAKRISNETWDLIINDHVKNKIAVTMIAKKYSIPYSTIYYGLINHGVTPSAYSYDKRKFYVNDAYFDNIDSDEKAYTLGLFLCDGSAQSNRSDGRSGRIYIKLKESDKYLLETIKNNVAPEYKLTKGSSVLKHTNKTYISYRLEISSSALAKALHKLGMHQDKFMRTLPKIDDKFKGALIRGIFDADGSISRTKRKGVANSHQVYIAQSNIPFMQNLQKYIGFGSLYTNKRSGRDMMFLRFNSAEEKLMLHFMMYNTPTLFLKRKKEIYTNYVNTVLSSEIKKSEPA